MLTKNFNKVLIFKENSSTFGGLVVNMCLT